MKDLVNRYLGFVRNNFVIFMVLFILYALCDLPQHAFSFGGFRDQLFAIILTVVKFGISVALMIKIKNYHYEKDDSFQNVFFESLSFFPLFIFLQVVYGLLCGISLLMFFIPGVYLTVAYYLWSFVAVLSPDSDSHLTARNKSVYLFKKHTVFIIIWIIFVSLLAIRFNLDIFSKEFFTNMQAGIKYSPEITPSWIIINIFASFMLFTAMGFISIFTLKFIDEADFSNVIREQASSKRPLIICLIIGMFTMGGGIVYLFKTDGFKNLLPTSAKILENAEKLEELQAKLKKLKEQNAEVTPIRKVISKSDLDYNALTEIKKTFTPLQKRGEVKYVAPKEISFGDFYWQTGDVLIFKNDKIQSVYLKTDRIFHRVTFPKNSGVVFNDDLSVQAVQIKSKTHLKISMRHWPINTLFAFKDRKLSTIIIQKEILIGKTTLPKGSLFSVGPYEQLLSVQVGPDGEILKFDDYGDIVP
jgi:hypothetical protein